MKGSSLALAGCGLVALALPGCSTAEPCCNPGLATPGVAGADLTVLDDELSPLRDAFNGTSKQWRVVALVSPTCSECVLGAEAVKREITDRYDADHMAALIVWIPMLPSDSEKAARASAPMFAPSRAQQFYDGNQSLGWDYARRTFPGFMQRARQSMPDDDPLADVFDERARQEVPQWDLYMLYAPGVVWQAEAGPPMPTHWIRHCGRQDGEISTYWRDSPDTPPQRGDLYEAMRDMVNDAMDSGLALTIEVLRVEDCPNAQATRDAVEEAVTAIGLNAHVRFVNQESLSTDDPRRSWPSPTILVDGRELFGMSPSRGTMSACRAYPNGAPSTKDVSEAFRALALR